MYFKQVLVVLLFHYCHFVVSGDVNVAINCGSIGNSTALDGREWVGESATNFMSSAAGRSRSSVAVDRSFLGVDPVPYVTCRISTSPFHLTFQVGPGQKFIRFHWFPASYRGFEKSTDLFNVKAGPFTLLNDFSPTQTCGRLGVKYLVKEFILSVEDHGQLRITFSPSDQSSSSSSCKSRDQIANAFLNGIEIISMPTGLYYTPDGDLGAPVSGHKYSFHNIDSSTALEMVQRLNVGGNFMSPVEDFGMFRRWTADADYFVESGVCRVSYRAPNLAYRNMHTLIAPPKIYQTSWKTARMNIVGQQMHNFTWKIPINLGFGYLVRLHFCDTAMPESEKNEFSILINNQIVETGADVHRGFPVYKDYVVMMKGQRESDESHLFVVLRSLDGLALGLLKGIEIFKLSNLENCLATAKPAFSKKLSNTWDLNINRFFSLFSKSNVIGTVMTIIVSIVSTSVDCLRQIWEENVLNEKDTQSASVEPFYRLFSLADIKSATQDFSDAHVIGRGGFGKVYKGLISGVSGIVAIKRLSFFSRQGAREFWAEIEILAKLRHVHLVSLIGYCDENEEMILVYEYIAGGTLADNLYKFARKGKDCAILSWDQRLRICIGAARGLDYLHTGSETGIIHRDVKDTNILLDDNYIPKISDLGLSKLEKHTTSKSYISTKIKGTIGYLDPEYFRTSRLTKKSDVYSFGVVLLVVLSGRPVLDSRSPGEPESLPACFQECISKGKFDRIVDPNLYNKISPESLKEFVKSVENCLQQQPKSRPTMAQLVVSLEKVLQLQEKPIFKESGDALTAQHIEVETIQTSEMSRAPVSTRLEENALSPPMEEITQTEALLRGEDQIRKPFWSWLWKTVQSKGKPRDNRVDDAAAAAQNFQVKTAELNETSYVPLTTIIEENVVSRPTDEINRTKALSRGEEHNFVRKRFWNRSWKTVRTAGPTVESPDGNDIDESATSPGGGHVNKIVFFEGCSYTFDLEEMLRASAEVVGKGTYGTTYLANLDKERQVAVKRLRGIEIGKEEFERHMNVVERVGKHTNILPLRGYYYSKDEKLVFSDYMPAGSLCAALHGYNKSRTELNWESRKNISVGVARGIAHLHSVGGVRYAHGNIRSSNVLLNKELDAGFITDFGWNAVWRDDASRTRWITTFYRAPEVIEPRNVSQKSDVYSFGVLLLEMLTGLAPLNMGRDDGVNLPRWFSSIIGEQWTAADVFDVGLLKYQNAEEEMVEMLQIAMSCVAEAPQNRPSMDDVVGRMEDLCPIRTR